jgi:hypothetical protein
MSLSFGVATASLAAALFVPDRAHSSPYEIVHGIHMAFLMLGVFTVLSALLFRQLKANDGDSMSLHKVALPEE